jgi:hypothetical protein
MKPKSSSINKGERRKENEDRERIKALLDFGTER